MAEVLAILAVISVLAAVATPGFVSVLRDRRTAQDTGMFADAFRVARARSLGHGTAVRVDVTTGDIPSIVLSEHITGPVVAGVVDPGSQPVAGCNAVGVWRVVEVFRNKPNTTRLEAFPHTDLTDDQSAISVCYSPRGRTMVNYPDAGGGTSFIDLPGVVKLTTERAASEGTTDGKVREIYVLPNGLTRMAL